MNAHHSEFISKLKSSFNVTQDLSDVIFIECSIKKYHSANSESLFGEKLSLIYTSQFSIYNVQFSFKILAFSYENSSEILKLDLDLHDKVIEKEIGSCRNFLKRHRNLNGMFKSLIEFAKLLETRRLIAAIVFSKEQHISLERHEDGGLMIKYARRLHNGTDIYVGIGWRIDWDLKECCPVDVVDVYYNNFIARNVDEIKENLTALTHPSLDFHAKLKLWKNLLKNLNERDCTVQAVITITESPPRISEAEGILVISDNDDDDILNVLGNKRRKVDTQISSSSVVHIVPD